MQSTCYSSDINENSEFSRHFSIKPLKYQISWKSVHWKPRCSMLTERQSDMKEANGCFPQFWEAACHRYRLYKNTMTSTLSFKIPRTWCRQCQQFVQFLTAYSIYCTLDLAVLLVSLFRVSSTVYCIKLLINIACSDAGISLCTADAVLYIFNLPQDA